jgi:GT2 family glycosyltransferase
VVVNWNGADLLASCLDALLAQTRPVRVVVVDNGSTDGSAAIVAARPAVEWIPLGENTGFAAACNVGMRRALRAGARHVALVNNDAVLDRDWLALTVAAADAHPEAGLFCGLMVFADEPEVVNSSGLVFDAVLRARDRDFRAPLSRAPRADGPVPGVTGGAALLRSETLRRVGLFDPELFIYCEDADLSLRAARAGVAAFYVAAARAVHGFGRTVAHASPRRRHLLARNHLRVAARHLPLPVALALVPALAFARVAVNVPLELVRGRRDHASAQLRAVVEGLSGAARDVRNRLAGVTIPPGAEPPAG